MYEKDKKPIDMLSDEDKFMWQVSELTHFRPMEFSIKFEKSQDV